MSDMEKKILIFIIKTQPVHMSFKDSETYATIKDAHVGITGIVLETYDNWDGIWVRLDVTGNGKINGVEIANEPVWLRQEDLDGPLEEL